MKLIIAEKPSVAREIARLLGADQNKNGYLEGDGISVTWALGHLVGLALPESYTSNTDLKGTALPIIPDAFLLESRKKRTPKGYEIDKGVEQQLKIIAQLFQKCDSIIVATDAGREGELIFRYIYTYLNCAKPFQRLWISSLTDKAIQDGFKNLHPGHEFDNLYLAAKARSEADWLVGINASKALSNIAGQGSYSLGRVQSPTLVMIANRYLDNKKFQSMKYWQLQLCLAKDNLTFKAQFLSNFDDLSRAEQLYDELKQVTQANLAQLEKRQVKQAPPLLFDLTALQKEANKKFHFSAQKTLSITQSLYESKRITYPRTGSKYISEDIFEFIPGLLSKLCLAKQIPFEEYYGASISKSTVNDAKITDHHAILITDQEMGDLDKDQQLIYDLICLRILEAFAPVCLKEVTTGKLILLHEHEFKISATVVCEAGWRSIQLEKDEEDKETENTSLPALLEGEEIDIQNLTILEKNTKPKPLHTEATLLSAMENVDKDVTDAKDKHVLKGIGIGTPATRAAIIETLLNRQYITREKTHLIPTEKGLQVVELVRSMRIANVDLTAEWESTLAKIESGQISVDTFNKAIVIYTQQVTEEILLKSLGQYKLCPKCKEETLRFFNAFAKCQNDKCQWIVFNTIASKKLTAEQFTSLIETGNTQMIKGLKSKAGKLFDAAIYLDENFETRFKFEDKPHRKK